jgi:hypothetical protein
LFFTVQKGASASTAEERRFDHPDLVGGQLLRLAD